MIDRTITKYDENGNIISQSLLDVDWDWIRNEREKEFARTDYWALKDLTMSQEKKDYRKFLRDLPENFESANAACDAWFQYEIPE